MGANALQVNASSSVKQASLPNVPAWAVVTKAESHVVLQLHDQKTGKLLAVMDASHLQTLRRCLMGALSVDLLARADATRVAVLGGGPLASGVIKALRLVPIAARGVLVAG